MMYHYIYMQNIMTEKWTFEIIESKRNGSCFYDSIANAMTENVSDWYEFPILRERMEKYWNDYHEKTGETLLGVTDKLIRFMCSENIDNDILEMYNVEAEFRKDSGEKGVHVFKSVDEYKHHVLHTNCWADHSMFLAFHRSLGNRCSLIVFDSDSGGIPYLDKEWTENKDVYICLQRDNNHYSTIRLVDNGKKLDLCVSRSVIMDMVDGMNESLETPIVITL